MLEDSRILRGAGEDLKHKIEGCDQIVIAFESTEDEKMSDNEPLRSSCQSRSYPKNNPASDVGFVTDSDDEDIDNVTHTQMQEARPQSNDGALEALMLTPRGGQRKRAMGGAKKPARRQGKRSVLKVFKHELISPRDIGEITQVQADDIILSLSTGRKSGSKALSDALWNTAMNEALFSHSPVVRMQKGDRDTRSPISDPNIMAQDVSIPYNRRKQRHELSQTFHVPNLPDMPVSQSEAKRSSARTMNPASSHVPPQSFPHSPSGRRPYLPKGSGRRRPRSSSEPRSKPSLRMSKNHTGNDRTVPVGESKSKHSVGSFGGASRGRHQSANSLPNSDMCERLSRSQNAKTNLVAVTPPSRTRRSKSTTQRTRSSSEHQQSPAQRTRKPKKARSGSSRKRIG